MNLSIRRELSKSHGDLSNLRPKSPPIHDRPTELQGLHLSPGNYVDDTQNLFSSSYNRQARQAIPNDWIISASGSQPSTTIERSASAGQQIYCSPLYGMRDFHHIQPEPATISIQGLTSGYIQPLDFCVPVTRSHPGDEDQRREALHGDTGRNLAVEHVDISTAWNGLSDVDAKELFRVHQAFVSTLEKMLANELWQIYQQRRQQDSAGNIRPIPTLFSAGIVRGISFCRDQLVSEMAKALYSSNEDTATAKSGFLRLYLIANDALAKYHEDGSRDTSITIRVRCDPLSLRPYPVVDAAWVPDSLLFEGLDVVPLEGQSFSIVPRYYSKSAFRPTHFPKNVKYSIESESRHCPLSWLVWDDDIAGFKGIVPFYSEVNSYDRRLANTCREPREISSNSLKMIVQAVLVDDNGSSIRYERILRARLTIKVVPWYAIDYSRETNERSSVPKAYQDKRLASAAQRFALQGPIGYALKPGQSRSGLSYLSNGDHLYAPNEYLSIGQVGTKDRCSAMSSSATEAGLGETDLLSSAQTQAYLVAKCTELTRELESVKEQVMRSSLFREHHNRTLHVPDSWELSYRPYCHHTGNDGSTNESLVPCISHCASEHLITPSSPGHHGRDAAFQLGPNARFSVLPPPAIGLTTRPGLDPENFNDGIALDATGSACNPAPGPSTTSQFATPEEGSMTQDMHSILEPGQLWRLPEEASKYLDNTGTAHSSPRQHGEALSNPPMVKGELATLSTPGLRGRKRRARSSLNEISPFRRSKEIGKQPKQEVGAHSAEPDGNTLPALDSEDEEIASPTQWSSSIFYNSFGPLQNLASSTTLAGEDALALQASEKQVSTDLSDDLKHSKQESVCYMDTEHTDSDGLAYKTSPVSSGLDDGATPAEGVHSSSFSPDWTRRVRLRQSSSTSFSPRHARTSSTSGSQSTSSDVEFIIEQDPRARNVSRLEQAKLWNLLSQPDNDKETQPGPEGKEVKLSEDERKAMDEAMRRSLNDLAEGFDDIFLEDSSESNSGDDL